MNLSIFLSLFSWYQPAVRYRLILEEGRRQRAEAKHAKNLVARLRKKERVKFVSYDNDTHALEIEDTVEAMFCTFKLPCTPDIIPNAGTRVIILKPAWDPEKGLRAKGFSTNR